MSPESCLNHADIVCIGDGEETLLDIVKTINKGGELEKIPGIMFLKNDQTIKTTLRQRKHDLDCYPPPDFSFKEHFWLYAVPGEEKIMEITPQNYPKLQKKYPDVNGERRLVPYKTVFARGCSYTCSYCSIGSQDKKIFPFRTRSVENVINELQQVIASYGDIIDVISFSDDTFLNHPEKWIAKFCELYTDKIKYPFRVLGHPLAINYNKVEMLCKAGCMHFGMGIESLSKNILYDVYNRKTPVHKVVDAANLLVDISKKFDILPPTFDVILANPYECLADKLESFRGLTKIGQPAKYTKFHLCFFPGSKLFLRAVEDGIIDKDDPIHYRSWCSSEVEMETYLNILYELIGKNRILSWYLQLLSSPAIFGFFNFLFGKSQLPYNSLRFLSRGLSILRFLKRKFATLHKSKVFESREVKVRR